MLFPTRSNLLSKRISGHATAGSVEHHHDGTDGFRTGVAGLMVDMVLKGSETRLRIWGNLDWLGAVTLRDVVDDLVLPGHHFVIDLTYLQAIDSVGTSALTGTLRRVNAAGGSTRLCNAPDWIRRRTELMTAERFVGSKMAVGDDAV
jgi:anti-anti-sigma factor